MQAESQLLKSPGMQQFTPLATNYKNWGQEDDGEELGESCFGTYKSGHRVFLRGADCGCRLQTHFVASAEQIQSALFCSDLYHL